jgi:Glyoxalase-like domain
MVRSLPAMSLAVQVVFDCHDADLLADFWAKALEYVPEPPPGGFDTWEAFLEANDFPLPEPGSISAVVDPAGVGPRLLFKRVPENKVVKNRVHLDVRADDRRDHKVAELEAAGGEVLRRVTEQGRTFITMADPEGNELDVTGTSPDD